VLDYWPHLLIVLAAGLLAGMFMQRRMTRKM
jgi:hypothetical protein